MAVNKYDSLPAAELFRKTGLCAGLFLFYRAYGKTAKATKATIRGCLARLRSVISPHG
jgi:hypothetical protein